jgi:hypothetical protein
MREVIRPLTPEARARLAGVKMEGSPFSAPWRATTDLLDRELWALGVRAEYVLMIDVTERDLKLDGGLRANARPASPAVAIAFTTGRLGDLMFACGKFRDWHDNVHAIALGLEALRKVDRYGITKSAEQYKGWSALPPGTPMPPAELSLNDALTILADLSGMPVYVNNAQSVNAARRVGVRRHHPDTGGDPEESPRLTEAYERICLHLRATGEMN